MTESEILPKNVLRRETPPRIESELAFGVLCFLVGTAAKNLSQLGQNPVAIAASPNRFNDNVDAGYWLAIRCGTFFRQNDGFGFSYYGFDEDIALASSDVKAAHAVLLELEAANWRDLFGKGFGFEWTDQSLSIVVQNGISWLVFSSNNSSNDGDPVFAIGGSGELTYIGEAEERFDWAIEELVPLVFRVDHVPDDSRRK